MLKTNSDIQPKYNAITDIWDELVSKFSDLTAIKDRYSQIELTYGEFIDTINKFACGLQELGLKQGDHVAQFSENSAKWMITDQAIIKCGAVNAVRGSQAPREELGYIYRHSDSCVLAVENSSMLYDFDDNIDKTATKFAIYFFEDMPINAEHFDYPVYSYEQVLEKGIDKDFTPVNIKPFDIATIVYSSGTTGKPKGIMLTHSNIISQIKYIPDAIRIKPGKIALNVLPIWHTYERTCEYFLLTQGCEMNYTNLRNFKKDLLKVQPNILITVPRLWEAIYDGVFKQINSQSKIKQNIFNFFIKHSVECKKAQRVYQKRCIRNQASNTIIKHINLIKTATLKPIDKIGEKVIYSKIKEAVGGKLEVGVSGGGALPKHIDDFLESVGINVIVGYGLTETAPVLSVRRLWHNEIYSAGQLLEETQVKVVDPETKAPLKHGQKGLILVRGPQVMRGYYKDTEATAQVINSQGWFNTGDIGWVTKAGSIVLTGRLKDTIVLSNGENVEPDCIEQACLKSPYIKQIMLVGQDKNALGALITPDEEAIAIWAQCKNIAYKTSEELIEHQDFKKLLGKEIQKHVQTRPNFRPYERIACYKILNEEFSVNNGLMTHTAKIKKHEVVKRYAKVIEGMYKM